MIRARLRLDGHCDRSLRPQSSPPHHLGADCHKYGQRATRGGDSKDKRADPVAIRLCRFGYQLALLGNKTCRSPRSNGEFRLGSDLYRQSSVASMVNAVRMIIDSIVYDFSYRIAQRSIDRDA
jgi:hypothetical protein